MLLDEKCDESSSLIRSSDSSLYRDLQSLEPDELDSIGDSVFSISSAEEDADMKLSLLTKSLELDEKHDVDKVLEMNEDVFTNNNNNDYQECKYEGENNHIQNKRKPDKHEKQVSFDTEDVIICGTSDKSYLSDSDVHCHADSIRIHGRKSRNGTKSGSLGSIHSHSKDGVEDFFPRENKASMKRKEWILKFKKQKQVMSLYFNNTNSTLIQNGANDNIYTNKFRRSWFKLIP